MTERVKTKRDRRCKECGYHLNKSEKRFCEPCKKSYRRSKQIARCSRCSRQIKAHLDVDVEKRDRIAYKHVSIMKNPTCDSMGDLRWCDRRFGKLMHVLDLCLLRRKIFPTDVRIYIMKFHKNELRQYYKPKDISYLYPHFFAY